ncbi:hypothetical protein [Streptomyces sp. NPDC006368]|uniref:hypothetical protein n=1 Tax=Streptomyces sp. NPDC006368 TaxID=3156760 RepID=UPI0033A01503
MQSGPRPPRLSPHAAELRERVRRLLGLDDDIAVVIREFAGVNRAEPGRSSAETSVTIMPMDGPARRWVVHRRPDQITEKDLHTAFATHSDGA